MAKEYLSAIEVYQNQLCYELLFLRSLVHITMYYAI